MGNYGDFQYEIYLKGLDGEQPDLPMTYGELERRAEGVMTQEMWSYVAGGAGDERTQRANVAAFGRWGFMPRVLAGASSRDLSIDLFGSHLPTPLLFAPVGVIGICDPAGHGDVLTARAAAASGVPMIASTLSQDPMEVVAKELGDTPGWFQLYPPNDAELTESFVRRAEASGFSAIVVTLDTLTLGWRPRDLSIASFPQLKGVCLANYLSDPIFRARLTAPPEENLVGAIGLWSSLFGNPGLNWDDLTRLRSLTRLPLLLKGICHPEDARRAVDAGVDGVYCSTHGGRQANGGLGALDCLPDVVEAVGEQVPVVFDSGVRSGPDVLTALALGASAVGIGRPYAYGLAVGGQRGIEHVVKCFLAEMDLMMAVDGYPDVAGLTPATLRRLVD
ncbi:MAG TPA: alpha-hydroxy-acid oxidizing protein [Acidimicrobiales bacterium]|nr:alpha-hydroxy-acid oxidizing protein [Acidimicrobiales bacterium]